MHNIISVNGASICGHPNERTTVGPTTTQINHYCPDCKQDWTTFPEASKESVSASGETFASRDSVQLAHVRRYAGEWHRQAVALGYDGVSDLLETLAASSEPEAQKAVAWEPEMRELIAKLRGGDWSLRSPDELACMIADMLERAIPRIASPSPAASMEVQGLTEREIGACIDNVYESSEYSAHHFGWHKQLAAEVQRALAAKNGWRLGEGRG